MKDGQILNQPQGNEADRLDRAVRSEIATLTRGINPTGLAVVSLDWMQRLALSPGKQAELWLESVRHTTRLMAGALGAETGVAADRRFASEGWDAPPFRLVRDAFLASEGWWMQPTSGLSGTTPQNEAALQFALRQTFDAMAPSNFPHLNPDVLSRARETNGESLVRGWMHLIEDVVASARGAAPENPKFRIGTTLAATPGKVVARTRLAELIQYSPTTTDVYPEPILIVPAWIMKYYILDLSAHNSMVAWLVGQGFTVFMISWLNPGSDERDLGMADYLEQGPMAALAAIQAITGASHVHGVGYCLGGTLLSIAAAEMARDGDLRLASMTLLAAQTDFSEAGDLSLFVSEAQVSQLEDLMWKPGYLDGAQMAQAFTLMHSNDLVWSKVIHEYLMGDRPEPNDMMVWNANTTRMPYRMHSEYLRGMFLNNLLATGKYEVDGRKVSLTDLRLPILAVGTETDHVAPWRSVFKIHRLSDAETTFVLTSGGHNAGIVSEPGHRHRHYRIATKARDDHYCDPETWVQRTAPVEGSWWPAWASWLATRSGARQLPPPTGSSPAGFPPLCDAPGTYVFQR